MARIIDTPSSLAADMLKAAGLAVVATRKVVQASAKTVRDEARDNVLKSAPVHNAGAFRTITYETAVKVATIDGVIGYDRAAGSAASLGNLLEYGGGGDRSPAHRDLGRALDSEVPRFEDALKAMAAGLL